MSTVFCVGIVEKEKGVARLCGLDLKGLHTAETVSELSRSAAWRLNIRWTTILMADTTERIFERTVLKFVLMREDCR